VGGGGRGPEKSPDKKVELTWFRGGAICLLFEGGKANFFVRSVGGGGGGDKIIGRNRLKKMWRGRRKRGRKEGKEGIRGVMPEKKKKKKNYLLGWEGTSGSGPRRLVPDKSEKKRDGLRERGIIKNEQKKQKKSWGAKEEELWTVLFLGTIKRARTCDCFGQKPRGGGESRRKTQRQAL